MPPQVQDTLFSLAPELLVCLTALTVLLWDLFSTESRRTIVRLCTLGLILAGAAVLMVWSRIPLELHPYAARAMVFDELAMLFKFLTIVLTLLTVWLSEGSFAEESRHPGEYYSMLLFVALGCLVAVSAVEFLTFFVAFELLSLPLYMLAAFRRWRPDSAEAGFKYFLNGALSSALMLYGISWIYGALGTTVFSEFNARLPHSELPYGLLVGFLLVMSALAFKISAAPFHMWAPDVYEGAPTPVVAYLSSVPKAAMVAVLLRIFWVNLDLSETPLAFGTDWFMLFSLMAVLSMTLGNLVALPQTNVKRLMAYSGIAHMGYTLLGLAVCTQAGAGALGAAAAIYYTVIYTVANLGAWGVIIVYSRDVRSETVSSLGGMASRNPFLALVLMVSFLSLAGAPPLAGFVGKLYLFRAVYQAGLMWLVLYAILNSVISLYYYFRVLRSAYFAEPRSEEPVQVPLLANASLVICLLGTVLLGIWPGLARMCLEIAKQLLG
ncbi:MAG: NADH-quinone oxidoreductase subunit N [Armatimonadetes bacterium]|nr:NADH-quinone oxidoreductase subunit N [Armatimonadota bacterium]